MFCRNCGRDLAGTPEVCINCGAKPIAGTSFCPGCGAPTMPLTEVCTNCGARLAGAIKEKTWKPTVAGILCIIAGAIGVFSIMVITLVGLVLMGDPSVQGELSMDAPIVKVWIFGGIATIIAIVGGIYALKRRVWGLALAGSIALVGVVGFGILRIFPIEPLVGFGIPGILAIIFVSLGKREFK